jgi:acetoin utilization deacetylase AcuC-like enzyme
MSSFGRLLSGRRRKFRVYYDEAFRLPLSGAEAGPAALETRRADDAVHYLLHERAVDAAEVINPEPVSYEALARVHLGGYLEALHEAGTLASIFAVDPSDVYVDEVVRSVRLGCGATLDGARFSLKTGRPALNLFGGFHHAAPSRGAGFCALNDVATAIKALRAEGFSGRVAVLDFDFHPPDGTAECLGKDPSVWLGSVSGVSWGPLEGVDETVLPPGTGDIEYLEAVEALLSRMPPVELAFILAGADVLAGDRLGQLAISVGGARRRELLVAHRLGRLPQVWLAAGGYSPHAWKVLAGVGLTLAFDSDAPIPFEYNPLGARMLGIAHSLKSETLGDLSFVTEADVADVLGLPREGPRRLLNFYTAEGLEYALERYRVLPLVRRLGFGSLRVSIDRVGACDRGRLLGRDMATGQQVTLIELEVERRRLGEGTFLFINWLSLRNPRARFSKLRPQLPGQEVPGLGLAREMTMILGLMAKRLHVDGVAFRPSWFHMAWTARHGVRFLDPRRQGRFEALGRDLRDVPLLEATRAVAEGRVLLNGEPYEWEADEMVRWQDDHVPDDGAQVAAERERCHFTVSPVAPSAPARSG